MKNICWDYAIPLYLFHRLTTFLILEQLRLLRRKNMRTNHNRWTTFLSFWKVGHLIQIFAFWISQLQMFSLFMAISCYLSNTTLHSNFLQLNKYDYHINIHFKFSFFLLFYSFFSFGVCVGDFADLPAFKYILHAHIAYHKPRTHATNK